MQTRSDTMIGQANNHLTLCTQVHTLHVCIIYFYLLRFWHLHTILVRKSHLILTCILLNLSTVSFILPMNDFWILFTTLNVRKWPCYCSISEQFFTLTKASESTDEADTLFHHLATETTLSSRWWWRGWLVCNHCVGSGGQCPVLYIRDTLLDFPKFTWQIKSLIMFQFEVLLYIKTHGKLRILSGLNPYRLGSTILNCLYIFFHIKKGILKHIKLVPPAAILVILYIVYFRGG